jgi:hypothetical protein
MGGRFHRVEVAAASLVLVLGLGGCGGGTGRDFADPAGDVKGGTGPDLTLVSVSHTSSTVTFRFRFAKQPPLAANVEGGVDMLVAGIDVPPRSLKRGVNGWSGLDYFAGLHGTEKTAVVVKASPAGPSQPNRVLARPEVTVSGRTLSFSIRRSTLGDPAWIEFAVAAGRESSGEAAGGGGDEAPDSGTFHYQLQS